MKECFDRVDRNIEEFSKRIGSVRRIAGENMRDIEDLKEKIEEKSSLTVNQEYIIGKYTCKLK